MQQRRSAGTHTSVTMPLALMHMQLPGMQAVTGFIA